MTAVLALKGVTKRFEGAARTLEVLSGIDLDVASGELVALVGASGSGKSTLLQIAGLLDGASDGEVWLNGVQADKASDTEQTQLRRDLLGFVYQFHHLLPDFTALENVAIAGRIQGLTKRQADEQARGLLAMLKLSDREDHVPSRLSGGEQQRVAIARALMGEPVLLLADEPTGNLDSATSKRVFDLMATLVEEQGVAALIVTHDLALAQRANRTMALDGGRIGTLGTDQKGAG